MFPNTVSLVVVGAKGRGTEHAWGRLRRKGAAWKRGCPMGRAWEQAHPALCWAVRATKSPQGAGEVTQVGGREAQGQLEEQEGKKARGRCGEPQAATGAERWTQGGRRGAWGGGGARAQKT